VGEGEGGSHSTHTIFLEYASMFCAFVSTITDFDKSVKTCTVQCIHESSPFPRVQSPWSIYYLQLRFHGLTLIYMRLNHVIPNMETFPIVLVGTVGEWCEAKCERVMSERLSGVDCGAVWGCGAVGCGSVGV